MGHQLATASASIDDEPSVEESRYGQFFSGFKRARARQPGGQVGGDHRVDKRRESCVEWCDRHNCPGSASGGGWVVAPAQGAMSARCRPDGSCWNHEDDVGRAFVLDKEATGPRILAALPRGKNSLYQDSIESID